MTLGRRGREFRLPRATAIAVVTLLAGCGASAEPPPPEPTRLETVYLLAPDQLALAPVQRRVPAAERRRPRALLDALAAGLTPAEENRGISSALPLGARATRVEVVRGVATVELQGVPPRPTPERGRRMAAQIARTLVGDAVHTVALRLDGDPWPRTVATDLTPGTFTFNTFLLWDERCSAGRCFSAVREAA
jgi:hypothetical protein